MTVKTASRTITKKKPAKDINAGKVHFADFSTDGIIPRLIASVEGKQGSGKTHFALTAPDPIAFINLDRGDEGVIEKFGDKKISTAYIRPVGTEEGAKQQMKIFSEAYDYSVLSEESEFRTVIVDTNSVLWELLRMSLFGSLKAMPTNYMEPNLKMANIARKAAESDKHVIFLHRLKEEWGAKGPTGNFVFSGHKEMPYLVQAVIRLERGDSNPEDYNAVITRCRHNTALIGRKFPKPVCSFPMVASTILKADIGG